MSEAAQPPPEELIEAHRLIDQLRDQLTHKEALIGQLLHQLQCLRRHRFGQRSEQLPADLQGELFDALKELDIEPPPPPEPKPNTAPRHKPRRQPPPAHLPRERIEYRLDESACTCGACGERLEKIGEECSEQLEYIPASFFVYEHVRFKYACPQCEAGGVVTAPKSPQALDKGLPGPGLLAHVLTSKYGDHLPLTRQQGIFKREQIHLSSINLPIQ